MPAFIRTKSDEKRWAKAKKAASKTLSESDGDSYWALTNSIYQKMKKSEEDIDALKSVLSKARRRLSDEPEEDEEDISPEEAGMHEIDPDQEDEADKWLKENDPGKGGDEDEPEEDYSEYGPEEDEEAHQRAAGFEPEAQAPEEGASETAGGTEAAPQGNLPEGQEKVGEGRFPQPTREELAEMRQYSRPWEQRAREKTQLEAEASKNPVLAHEGKLIEARNLSHRAHQEAYAAMQSSPEYQNADPITQMEMDSKFEADWHKQNPDYLSNAAQAHARAHIEGLKGMGEGAQAKKEAIGHVRRGGVQAEEPMSAEEAMQHAGGIKGEEGTVGTMVQDPAAKFARENKEFLEAEGGKHEKRAADREATYAKLANKYAAQHKGIPEYQKGDIHKVLGEHPALKNPEKRAAVDTFFQKYHPMIHMNANRVLNQLGLDKGSVDMGMLHEAGMHGLFQAINDYNHENPGKASFATHAGNKMRGLMQTALREHHKTPLHELARKFHPDAADRLKRVNVNKQIAAPKLPKPGGEGSTNE